MAADTKIALCPSYSGKSESHPRFCTGLHHQSWSNEGRRSSATAEKKQGIVGSIAMTLLQAVRMHAISGF